jgi:hypothetical protein
LANEAEEYTEACICNDRWLCSDEMFKSESAKAPESNVDLSFAKADAKAFPGLAGGGGRGVGAES